MSSGVEVAGIETATPNRLKIYEIIRFDYDTKTLMGQV